MSEPLSIITPAAPLAVVEQLMPDLKLTKEYEGVLREYADDPRESNLLPEEVADAIFYELEPAIKTRVSEDYARQLVTVLIESYPQTPSENPGIYLEAMISELQEFPPDIARDGVRNVRRSVKFLPSIAEVYQECWQLLDDRKGLQGMADEMDEHWYRISKKKENEEAAEATRAKWKADHEKRKVEEEKKKAEEEELERQKRRADFKEETRVKFEVVEQEAIKHFGEAIQPGMLWKIIQSLMIESDWVEEKVRPNTYEIGGRLILLQSGDPWAFEVYKRGAAELADVEDLKADGDLCKNVHMAVWIEAAYYDLPKDVRMKHYLDRELFDNG